MLQRASSASEAASPSGRVCAGSTILLGARTLTLIKQVLVLNTKLLNEGVRQIHFTIDTLETRLDQRMDVLSSLPSPEVMEVSKLVSRISSPYNTPE